MWAQIRRIARTIPALLGTGRRLSGPTRHVEFRANVTESILSKVGRKLHLQQHHPLHSMKCLIESHFVQAVKGEDEQPLFRTFDNLDPVVTAQQNFDDLLVGPNHPSRALTDTFYFSPTQLLRTHTSAHQTELLRAGHRAFLATGDCYRRDEIDSCHYPVFTQTEGVRIWPASEMTVEDVVSDLKHTLEGLVSTVFGEVECRWVDAYFPFTHPSLELEVKFKDEWLEVLGCGVIQHPILQACDLEEWRGWAFGLGLERLAMVLYSVPDIRLFWSQDPRFLSQFRDGTITAFKPFSKYPPVEKDVSFWCPEIFHENDLCDIVRDCAGDLVERVQLVDTYTNPAGRTSNCYRITYRSMDRTLTNSEIDKLQSHVVDSLASQLDLEIR